MVQGEGEREGNKKLRYSWQTETMSSLSDGTEIVLNKIIITNIMMNG